MELTNTAKINDTLKDIEEVLKSKSDVRCGVSREVEKIHTEKLILI